MRRYSLLTFNVTMHLHRTIAVTFYAMRLLLQIDIRNIILINTIITHTRILVIFLEYCFTHFGKIYVCHEIVFLSPIIRLTQSIHFSEIKRFISNITLHDIISNQTFVI